MQNDAMQSVEIRRLGEQFGAEATGADLTRPVDPELRQRLNDAAARQAFLVVRGQRFEPRQFLEAGRLFGQPMSRPYSTPLPDLPLVQRISSHDRDERGAVVKTGPAWHTDQVDDERPPKFTILYAIELFRTGGTTGILDMRAAYDALPAHLKERIQGLEVNYGVARTARARGEPTPSVHVDPPGARPVVHPLVRTIPETGRKALYLHPGRLRGIVGMGPEEARPLMVKLLEHAIRPEVIYNHSWALGDVLLWDNRQTLHRANYDYDPTDTTQHRCMYRMMVEGERPA